MSKDTALPAPSLRRGTRDATILVGLCYLCFVNALPHPFMDYDDGKGIRTNSHLHGLSAENVRHLLRLPSKGEWRRAYLPVRDFSLALDYSIWQWRSGARGAWEGVEEQLHLVNLLLHTANVILVYVLLLRLGIGSRVSLLGAAIFACHPLHVESVAWISGRKDVLSGALFLAALVTYVEGRGRWKATYGLALILYSLAVLTKATTIVLPGVILALDMLLPAGGPNGSSGLRERLSRCWKQWVPFALVGAVLCVLHGFVALKMSTVHPQAAVRDPKSLLSFIPAVAHYGRAFLFPTGLSLRYEGSLPFLSVSVGLSWGMALATVAFAWRWRTAETRFLLACLVWCALCLLPVIGLIPTSTLVADRYFYLPSVGACAALAWLIEGCMGRIGRGAAPKLLRQTSAAVVVLCLASLTVRRNTFWGDSELLWKDAARSAPTEDVVLYNLAGNYLRRGAYVRARQLLVKAHAGFPDSTDIMLNLSVACAETGQIEKADGLCRELLKRKPDDVHATVCRGHIRVAQGDLDEALELFGRAQRKHPRNVATHVGTGRILAAKGLYPEALRSLRKALELEPRSFDALADLAKVATVTKDFPAAFGACREILRMRPTHPTTLATMGRLYAATGHHDEALHAYSRLLAVQPGRASNHYELGVTLRALGRPQPAAEAWRECLRIDPGNEAARKALSAVGP